MGKNSDIESISNSLFNTILHKILIEYTNKQYSISHWVNEEVEYRGQSMRKIDRRKLNDEDKKEIKEKIIKKIINRLNDKYNDVKISQDIVVEIIHKEINLFFDDSNLE